MRDLNSLVFPSTNCGFSSWVDTCKMTCNTSFCLQWINWCRVPPRSSPGPLCSGMFPRERQGLQPGYSHSLTAAHDKLSSKNDTTYQTQWQFDRAIYVCWNLINPGFIFCISVLETLWAWKSNWKYRKKGKTLMSFTPAGRSTVCDVSCRCNSEWLLQRTFTEMLIFPL